MLSMLTLLSGLIASVPPMRPDTPPPLPVPAERFSDLKSARDIVSASRLVNGSPAPAQMQLPQLANGDEVLKYMIEHYPLALRDRYDFTMPWVWMLIDEHGQTGEAVIARSSGRAEYDSLALGALRIARFAPALHQGAPLAVWVPMPVQIAYENLADKAQRDTARDEDRPHFTPYTVKPELVNRGDVARALVHNYPPELRSAGLGGEVSLWLFVDETGRTIRSLVRKSSGSESLDRAAVEVGRQMRWTPAKNRDQVVAVWIAVPVVFQIRGN